MSTKNRLSRLNVESLEQREVPAILPNFTLSGATLYVNTDNADTRVTLSPYNFQMLGSNVPCVNVADGSNGWNFTLASVARVQVCGGSGNDRFVNNAGSLPVYFYGGAGNDTLIGGGGNDWLVGEAGRDVIKGMDGDDGCDGSDGDDTVVGGNGNDYLYGQNGNDQIVGGAGTNRLYGGNGDDTLVTIDGDVNDYADGGNGTDTMWRDRLVGSDYYMFDIPQSMERVYDITAFANASQGADRTLNGDPISDPTNGWVNGTTLKKFAENPLFGATVPGNPGATAPVYTDVRQGLVADSGLMSPLGAMAKDYPLAVRQIVADFGDGTFGVRLGGNFYRVDNELWTLKTNLIDPCYAGLGTTGSMWAAIVEKAYATAMGNSYVSLNGINSVNAMAAFGAVPSLSTPYSTGNWQNIVNYATSFLGSACTITITTIPLGAVNANGLLPDNCYTVIATTTNSVTIADHRRQQSFTLSLSDLNELSVQCNFGQY